MVDLPKKADDLIEWYLAVVEAAGLSDKRYPVKGMNVWTPYGFRARRNLDRVMVREIEAALDMLHVAPQPVEATRHAGILRFKQPKAFLYLGHVALEFRQVASDRPQHLQHQIVSPAAHARQDAPGRASSASAERAPASANAFRSSPVRRPLGRQIGMSDRGGRGVPPLCLDALLTLSAPPRHLRKAGKPSTELQRS